MTAADWDIPEPQATCEVRLDDTTTTTLRRYGNPQGRRLILSHGNGLAIDLYYPFWSLLVDDFDVVVYDIRNHGWNSLSPMDSHDVPTFIDDLRKVLDAIDRRFGAKPRIGVYHSLSALVALLSLSSVLASPSETQPTFDGLVLFDPPLYRPSVSEEQFDELAEPLARRTRRRGNRFEKLEDFVELVRYSPSFTRTVPGVHELLARTTLRKPASGEYYELRCPPEYEARIVEYARSYAGLVDLENLPCHVKVVGADPTLPFAYLPTFDLVEMDTVDYDFLPEATHYLQLEKPAECVAALREYLREVPT